MRVITNTRDWYPDDINSKLDFDEFSDPSSKQVLLLGLAPTYDKTAREALKQFERTVYVNLEHPCTLYAGKNTAGLSPIEQQTLFTDVYTICPYTVDWFNGMDHKTKFFAIPYPHNLKYNLYHSYKKDFDVGYAGLIHHQEIADYVEAIKGFKYVFTSIPEYNRVHSADRLITHNNVPNTYKWFLLGRTKTSVIQNNLYLTEQQIRNVKMLPSWEANRAFSHLDTGLLPQLKSRTVESALCKSLMLVKRDHWNVIERWFKPEEDFLYFDNPNDLKDKARFATKNYETSEVQSMVNSAYEKTVKFYNTKYLFQRMKERKSCETV